MIPLLLPPAPDGCLYCRDYRGHWWVADRGPARPLDYVVLKRLAGEPA